MNETSEHKIEGQKKTMNNQQSTLISHPNDRFESNKNIQALTDTQGEHWVQFASQMDLYYMTYGRYSCI